MHIDERHVLPVGQYGVGYAIALWAIRSAFESPPIALWAIRCRLRYCPMGNTLRWRGYVLAAVAACAHTPRSFWAESIAQKRLFFERYFAISQANLIVYCPKRWLVRSGGFFFVESS